MNCEVTATSTMKPEDAEELCLAFLTHRLSLELSSHLTEIVAYTEMLSGTLTSNADLTYLERIRSAGSRALEATRRVQALAVVIGGRK